MSIQRIPYEILQTMFKTIASTPQGKRDLFNCALVCQAWYLPVCRALYEDIKVKKMGQLLKCLSQQSENKGTFCKTLHFTSSSTINVSPIIYERLFSNLPNVQTIFLNYKGKRMYNLLQLSKNAILLQNLKEILLRGYAWTDNDIYAYYTCAYAYRNSLQRISLFYLNIPITASGGRSGNIISFLPDFTSLTSLYITNRELPQLDMFAVMRSCPKLINFSIDTIFSKTEDDDSNYRLHHNKLRSLIINFPGITRGHINYLVKNVTRLKSLELDCGFQRGSSVRIQGMEDVDDYRMKQLQVYVSNIHTVDFTVGANFKRDNTDYWSFVNGVITSKPSLPTHVYIKICDDDSSIPEKMVLRKRAGNIFIFRDMKLASISKMVNSTALLSTIITPFEISTNQIQSLHIHFDTYRISKDMIHTIRINIIGTVINHFSNLCDFSLKMNLSHKFTTLIAIASTEIDHSKNMYTSSSSTIASPLRPSSNSTKLSYVTLRDVQSTDAVMSILKVLTNTKYLKLHYSDLNPETESNYTLDLRDFSLCD